MEEMPIDYVTKHFSHLPRITLQFVYGPQHHGPKVFELGAVGATDGRYAESSTFLHPKMKFWKEGEQQHSSQHSSSKASSTASSARDSDWNHHSVEDVPTDFSTTQHRPFLLRYVNYALSLVNWARTTTFEEYAQQRHHVCAAPKKDVKDETMEGTPRGELIGEQERQQVEQEMERAMEQEMLVEEAKKMEEEYDYIIKQTFELADEDNDRHISTSELDITQLFNVIHQFDDQKDQTAGEELISRGTCVCVCLLFAESWIEQCFLLFKGDSTPVYVLSRFSFSLFLV
jgi:hypothetical protein